MCGVSTDADKNDILSIAREVPELKHTEMIRVENDTHTGLVGGLSGRPGCVLIAGTGSACFGVRSDNASYLSGGWALWPTMWAARHGSESKRSRPP